MGGSGTYFARDAKYVVDSNFCTPSADGRGSKKMLLCLLLTGIPCLGDPQQNGVLPVRQKPHRYNSSVDSLSSPEVCAAPQCCFAGIHRLLCMRYRSLCQTQF